jgi:hypothetical protein
MPAQRAATLGARNTHRREVTMEKLRLPIESLQVDTFDAGGADEERGTVEGRQACTRLQTTCNPDITFVMTGACHNCNAPAPAPAKAK